MYNGCRHIKASGLPCKSRALAGGSFCYFHAHLHNHTAGPEAEPLKMPVIEDLASIPLAVARISEALIADRIDVKKSAQLFWGLKLVFQAITFQARYEEAQVSTEDSVESVTQTPEGDDLGPDMTYCFPSIGECGECEDRKTCTDSPFYEVPNEEQDDEEDEDVDGEQETGSEEDDGGEDEEEGEEEEEEDEEHVGSSGDVEESPGDSQDDEGEEEADEEKDDDQDNDDEEEDDGEGEDDEGDSEDDDGDSLDNETTEELVARAKSLESVISAIEIGDMRLAARLLKE